VEEFVVTKDVLARLRAQARQVNREQHAIMALLQFTTTTEFEAFQRGEASFDRASAQALRTFIDPAREQIGRLKKRLGVRKSADLRGLYDQICAGPRGSVLYVYKAALRSYCENYASVVGGFERLPNHAKISVEDGSRRTTAGQYEIVFGELQAFQDMAALHNEAQRRSHGMDYLRADAETRKAVDATCRACTVVAYQVVEGYLNGLAFDFLEEPTHQIARDDELLLKEQRRDGATRFASFRAKLLDYPRIVKGAAQPLFDASNCEEVRVLLDRNKRVRDAIVHASPRRELEEFEPGKSILLGHVDFPEVLVLSKAVVALVRKLENAIRGDQDRLWWLADIQADNRFPVSVF
jgi:hypothetical protein